MRWVFVFMLLMTPLVVQGAAAGVVETTVRLNFTIGSVDDVFVGETKNPSSGVWYAHNLTKRILCAQNTTLASRAVSVTLASGDGFRNLNYTSPYVQLTQDYGSAFYLIFTDTNCTSVINNAEAIEKNRVSVQGTVPDVAVFNILAWISYPRINFTEPFRLSRGTFDVLVQNNGTSANVTKIKVVRA